MNFKMMKSYIYFNISNLPNKTVGFYYRNRKITLIIKVIIDLAILLQILSKSEKDCLELYNSQETKKEIKDE